MKTINEKIAAFEFAAREAVSHTEKELLENLEKKEEAEKELERLQIRIARLRAIEDVVSNGCTVKDYLKNNNKIEQMLDLGVVKIKTIWKSLVAQRNARAAMFRA
jgi:hypothetical protein